MHSQLGFKQKIAKNKEVQQQQQETIETNLRESMTKRQRELDQELKDKQSKRKDLLEKINQMKKKVQESKFKNEMAESVMKARENEAFRVEGYQ